MIRRTKMQAARLYAPAAGRKSGANGVIGFGLAVDAGATLARWNMCQGRHHLPAAWGLCFAVGVAARSVPHPSHSSFRSSGLYADSQVARLGSDANVP